MVATPEIRATELSTTVTYTASGSIETQQAVALVAYNIPTPELRVTEVGAEVVYQQIAQRMPVTEAGVLVVAKGSIGTPKIRSWGFTLDGHDFYVLKLGYTSKTFIFDISTGQWAWWSSADRVTWRALLGMNWRSSGSIPGNYGSNVIVGDDNQGILWVLDPSYGVDDLSETGTSQEFDRVATAQSIVRGSVPTPCYNTELVGTYGQPLSDNYTVTLEYSDDSGNTFVTASEPIVVQSGGYNQMFEWRSLGLMINPGRLFRITDYGALSRVDGLYLNE